MLRFCFLFVLSLVGETVRSDPNANQVCELAASEKMGREITEALKFVGPGFIILDTRDWIPEERRLAMLNHVPPRIAEPAGFRDFLFWREQISPESCQRLCLNEADRNVLSDFFEKLDSLIMQGLNPVERQGTQPDPNLEYRLYSEDRGTLKPDFSARYYTTNHVDGNHFTVIYALNGDGPILNCEGQDFPVTEGQTVIFTGTCRGKRFPEIRPTQATSHRAPHTGDQNQERSIVTRIYDRIL